MDATLILAAAKAVADRYRDAVANFPEDDYREDDAQYETTIAFIRNLSPLDAACVWMCLSDDEKRAAEEQCSTPDHIATPTAGKPFPRLDDWMCEAVGWHMSMNHDWQPVDLDG